MSIARAHSARRIQTTTTEALAVFLKVLGGGDFLKFSAKEGPISLGAFTRGVALSSAFD
jgi:hypothetical protein